MFKVSLEPMTEVVNDLQDVFDQLNRCAGEITQTKSALNGLSYLEDSLCRLSAEAEALNEKAALAMQMERVLGTVLEYYCKSDRRITDYCEETKITVHRENAAYYRLDWLSQMFK